MTAKSLPSFKHTSIGTKLKARTATAHVCYIMRSQAMTHFQAENMPDGGRGTRVFFDKLWEKAGMPEPARICDKFMIALPVELNQEQRHEVVRSFMQELGHGRIAWCAAHHDRGEDEHNPHAHVVFKDADIDTGRKVVGTTTSSGDVREAKEHGWKVPPRMTTLDLRIKWCSHLNDFMERAGLDIRYDPRKLKEQGIEREPQIHIGPKAQALDEKGFQFESRDRIRGERSIPYTLYDQDSRVAHNSRIIDSNKAREIAKDSPAPAQARPDDTEKRVLLDEQEQARRAMYKDQQRDRDALRLAQDATKRDHRTWAKTLYAGARETAYQTVKEQYAEKWEEVRALENLKQREKAAAALKLEEKKSYARESASQVNRCRPEKDAAWKTMQSNQEKERLDLRNQHRQETAALARQHIAERLRLHEKRRALSLEKQANRIDARLTSKQGMAAQQKAALDAIKLHARANQPSKVNGSGVAPANPREAARAYFETARAEQAKYTALRQTLLETRTRNLERAHPVAEKSQDRSAQVQPAEGRARAHAAANGKGSPREIVAPSIHAAKGNTASPHNQRSREADTQNQIRQAVTSGRTLSDGERANAPPEIGQRLSDREQKALAIRNLATGSSAREERSKGRTGGGRGR